MTQEATGTSPTSKRAKKTKRAGKAAPAKNSGKKAASGKGKRYSDKQKLAKLQKYQQLLEAGMRAPAAAKKVGVSYITLLAWQKKLGVKIKARRGGTKKKTASKRGRKPVTKRGRKPAAKRGRKTTKKTARRAGRKTAGKRVARAGAGAVPSGLVLVTPQGYRIEGISPRDLVKMMKALS